MTFVPPPLKDPKIYPEYVPLPGSSPYEQPFSQEDCTARFYFLPVEHAALQSAVDKWLNIPINDVYHYVALPWVTLVMMGIEQTRSIPQHDLGFTLEQDVGWGVTLAAFRGRDRQLVDHFAIGFPYLMVQNGLSMISGRDCYGHRKVLGEYELLPNTGIPIAAQTQAVKVSGPNARSKMEPVVRIDDLVDDLAMAEGHSLAGDLLAEFEHLLASGIEKVDGFFERIAERLTGDAERFILEHSLDARILFREFVKVLHREHKIRMVFLRQLRDIADCKLASYQSLIESPTFFQSMTNVVLLPKPTIRFYNNDSYPVVTDLGLQDTMKPLLAFQANLSFVQMDGRVIAEGVHRDIKRKPPRHSEAKLDVASDRG